jgi:hypothetical protein
VLADDKAMAALRALGRRLRAARYENQVISGPARDRAASEMALGYPVASEVVGQDEASALVASGAADLEGQGERLVPRFMLFALGEVIVLVPKDGGRDPDRVYFGRDSLWLADFASRCAPPGGALADLGTGAGTVAAVLAPRFKLAVGTEVLPRTAACAAVTFALNARGDGSPAALACLTDVTGGLAGGSFSLVTGNPPWVPDLDRGPDERARAYAEGGPTGFELPRRFIMEGAALLAPGGLMVMLALDVTWQDGGRPLRSLARGLLRLGFEVHLQPTEISALWEGTALDLRSCFPKIRTAEHVALVVRRPRSQRSRASGRSSTSGVRARQGEPEHRPEKAVGDQFSVDPLRWRGWDDAAIVT